MPPPPPVSDLTTHLGFWLRTVSNHVSHAFAAKIAEKGVTVAEWTVMRTLYGKDPMSPSRLADEMGMTRGAITKLADRLIGKALVRRTADPQDGRAQTLALTDRGTALVPDLAKLADQNDAETFGHLLPAERDVLEQSLKQIVAHRRITALPIA
ncbi:MarR family winged helix-turn-helix transcriptional regulator [Aquabacter spiritensis]|uniref:DNA-binding MarR family transcriptional regulator n=1 Tax=Aquabacter spiritensis TaxID=933073 RepID=A0A4R3M680_9HYPH|nr:MarR family transcriptional regulator [Aquabacter spiritensis]TCT07769.1 DNA-binding MarR family transcriptional regulator [Aquabacter spiritensis]